MPSFSLRTILKACKHSTIHNTFIGTFCMSSASHTTFFISFYSIFVSHTTSCVSFYSIFVSHTSLLFHSRINLNIKRECTGACPLVVSLLISMSHAFCCDLHPRALKQNVSQHFISLQELHNCMIITIQSILIV